VGVFIFQKGIQKVHHIACSRGKLNSSCYAHFSLFWQFNKSFIKVGNGNLLIIQEDNKKLNLVRVPAEFVIKKKTFCFAKSSINQSETRAEPRLWPEETLD